MVWTIPIYDRRLTHKQRIFNVEADDKGNIYSYHAKNIRGSIYVDAEDVKKQIYEFFQKKKIG